MIILSLILVSTLLFSLASISAFSLSNFWGKITGNAVNLAAGDCSETDGGLSWTASNNTVGLNENHDLKFFCLNNKSKTSHG